MRSIKEALGDATDEFHHLILTCDDEAEGDDAREEAVESVIEFLSGA